jgi:hypothetical protein
MLLHDLGVVLSAIALIPFSWVVFA